MLMKMMCKIMMINSMLLNRHTNPLTENYKLKHIKRRFFSCIHRELKRGIIAYWFFIVLYWFMFHSFGCSLGSKFDQCECSCRERMRTKRNCQYNTAIISLHFGPSRQHNSFSSTHPELFATSMIMMMTYIRPFFFPSTTNFFRSTPFN